MDKVEWLRQYCSSKAYSRNRTFGGTRDENYGPNCEKPDLDETDPAAYELKVQNHLKLIKEQWQDRENIGK